MGASGLVDLLNSAFLAGVADDDITKAGVFMRAFDQLEDGDRPWLPCQLEKCLGVSDRFASSIVNRRPPDLYTSGVGGIVISWEGVPTTGRTMPMGGARSRLAIRLGGREAACQAAPESGVTQTAGATGAAAGMATI